MLAPRKRHARRHPARKRRRAGSVVAPAARGEASAQAHRRRPPGTGIGRWSCQRRPSASAASITRLLGGSEIAPIGASSLRHRRQRINASFRRVKHSARIYRRRVRLWRPASRREALAVSMAACKSSYPRRRRPAAGPEIVEKRRRPFRRGREPVPPRRHHQVRDARTAINEQHWCRPAPSLASSSSCQCQ